MNKSELINEVAEKSGESKAAVSRVLESLQDSIISEVAKGEEIKLTGFASFKPHTRPACVRKNPRTGENVNVPEKTVVKVKVGKRFQDEVGKA